jgi:hypothetical protein
VSKSIDQRWHIERKDQVHDEEGRGVTVGFYGDGGHEVAEHVVELHNASLPRPASEYGYMDENVLWWLITPERHLLFHCFGELETAVFLRGGREQIDEAKLYWTPIVTPKLPAKKAGQ